MISRIGWVVTAAIVIYFQVKLTSPYLTFMGLFRAEVWLAIMANIGFAIAVGFQLFDWNPFRFTTKSLIGLTVLVSFSLAMVLSLLNHSAMKSAFAYSKNDLHQCTVDGNVGDRCGLYSITAISKGKGFTALFVQGDPEFGFDSCGFVHVTDEIDLHFRMFDKKPDYYFLSLGDGWYVFYSRYNWHKMGWS